MKGHTETATLRICKADECISVNTSPELPILGSDAESGILVSKSNLSLLCLKVVAPGDSLLQLPKNGKLRIGTGISVEQDQLVTNRCGVARQTKAGKIWIEGRQRR